MALFDAFLKIDGIKGESQDSKHKGEIDVLSFSWGLNQSGTFATGGGGGAGIAQFHDFSIIKKVDASSPLLMMSCAAGVHIKEASFVVRKAGGTQLEYLKIKMTDLLISAVQPGASLEVREAASQPQAAAAATASSSKAILIGLLLPAVSAVREAASKTGEASPQVSDSIPMEQISINFAKIELAYQRQGKDGKPEGGPIVAGYDIKQKKPV